VSLFTRNRLAGFALALATFGLDRGVKAWIAGPLALPEQGAIYITSFFNLRWTQNLGVSLGLFSANSSEGKLALREPRSARGRHCAHVDQQIDLCRFQLLDHRAGRGLLITDGEEGGFFLRRHFCSRSISAMAPAGARILPSWMI